MTNISQTLDAALLSAVLDMPAQEACTALATIPTASLTTPAETIREAITTHAQELTAINPEAPLSPAVVHSTLLAAGKLPNTDDGTRTLLIEITGTHASRYHFPALLDAVRDRHYRAVFHAVRTAWADTDLETTSTEELTHLITAGTQQLRDAYPAPTTIASVPAERRTA